MFKNGQKSQILIFLFLLSIIFIAGFVRFFLLDQAPSGAFIDEAHFGYIAYSLIETGADEHGTSWPLIFTGFGDQKLPAYAYILIPFVALFDLSVATIRLPSALMGTIQVLLVFFLLKKGIGSDNAGLTGALLMALSPFPFFLSRFGFESNAALFFWLIALNAIIRMPVHVGWAVLAAVSAAATWYAYIAYRPVSLFFVATIIILGWLWNWIPRQRLVVLGVVFSIMIAPFILSGAGGANTTRLKQVGIFYDQGMVAVINERRTFCSAQLPSAACYVAFNKLTHIFFVVGSRFLAVYSPEYLASYGEKIERFLTVPDYGQFYLFLYPFFILGLFRLFFSQEKSDNSSEIRFFRILIILGLLLAPVPSVLAGDPQKVRLSPLLPFLLVAYVLGIQYGWRLLSHALLHQSVSRRYLRVLRSVVSISSVGIFGAAAVHFLMLFYSIHVVQNDFMYQSYLRPLMAFVGDSVADGKTVLLKPTYSDPLMYYAFYTKMDPTEYQLQAVLGEKEVSGFQHTIALDRVAVTNDDLNTVACKALLSSTPTIWVTNEPQSGVTPVNIFRSRNGVMQYLFAYDASLHALDIADKCKTNPSVVQ